MLAKGHKRKQQIVDIARDMFINNGFQSTHIGKICEILNIARGTVYQYFGNKREILYAILESVEETIDDILDQDDLKDFLKTNPSQKSTLSFIINRLAESIIEIISDPIVIKLIFRDISGIDEGVVTRVNRFLDHILKNISIDIEEIVKKGLGRRSIDIDEAALMLIGGILFIVNNYNNKQKDKLDKDAIILILSNNLKGVLK